MIRKIRHASDGPGLPEKSCDRSAKLKPPEVDQDHRQIGSDRKADEVANRVRVPFFTLRQMTNQWKIVQMQAQPAQVFDGTSGIIPDLLVADDSPLQRHALCQFLRQSGYSVAEAGDGNAVVRHLQECPVDLLLLDLNMPGGDGFEVLQYLQEHRRSLPVILLSGMQLDQIQHQMHRLSKQELPTLLLKPVDPQQLLQVVEMQLSGEIPGAE